MSTEPIWINCEGSGCDAARGYCPMCGLGTPNVDPLPIVSNGEFVLIADHQRQDILAMIERGDFAP
jgi:hypothetical protein